MLAQPGGVWVARTEMKKKITVYQKPTCNQVPHDGGSIKGRGVEFDAINYYETPITESDLRGLLKKLGLAPRDILRKDEPVGKELGIGKKDVSDEELIVLMVKHPDLIQRPIVVRGNDAVLCCPPEYVEKLL
jgi:arsenate reductase